jgi:polycomb protein EED
MDSTNVVEEKVGSDHGEFSKDQSTTVHLLVPSPPRKETTISDGVPVLFLHDQPHTIKRVPSKRKRKGSNVQSTIANHKDQKPQCTTTPWKRQDDTILPNKSVLTSKPIPVLDDTTGIKTPNKINFSLQESFQQSTKKTIYSLTFSDPPYDQLMDDTDNSVGTHLLAICSHRHLVLYRISGDTDTATTTTTTTNTNTNTTTSTSSSTTDQEERIDTTTDVMDNSVTIDSKSLHNHSNSHVEYCYQDTDENEDYYACTFIGRISTTTTLSCNPNDRSGSSGHQLICVGGKNARIHVIDYQRNQVTRTLSGHGGEILDLQVCPIDEWLLLSASQDYSCRLWNVRAIHDAPIAIFSGHNGHGDGITTISWHGSGHQFVSGGIDNVIKVWEISDEVRDAIDSSNRLTDSVLHSSNVIDQVDWIATVVVQFPVFSTNRMHAHCVDCVEFLGDLIVSKSTENVVQLWYPIIQNQKSPFGDNLQPPASDAILLQTFHYCDGEFWFIRFAIEPQFKLLAVGTSHGTITIWKICDDDYKSVLKPIRNLYIHRPVTVRCVRFTPDGSMLLASTDDGTIFKWNLSFQY